MRLNYIQQAYKGLHDGWRYIVGVIIVILFVIAGQIPYTIAALLEAHRKGLNLFELNENVLMSLLEPNLNLALMLE